MKKIRDDDQEAVFINPEHIIVIVYRKKHNVLSISAKLVITTTKQEIVYDGVIADTVFENMSNGIE